MSKGPTQMGARGDLSSKIDSPGASPPGSAGQAKGEGPLLSLNSALFKEISVVLSAKLGETTLPITDLLTLKPGSVLTLDAQLNDLVELRLNQSVIARGELVAVGDNFGLRIVEVAKIT